MKNKEKAPETESRFLISPLYQKRLVNSNRFLCYKADKTPYNARTKKLANITCLNDYSSFNVACNCAKNTPDFKGIGFALGYDIASGYQYCGLDFDYCIDDNGNIHPAVRKIINVLNTYTEISMSKRGLHCIFIAKKQGKICKNNNLDFCKCLELYDNGHYFALTGNIIRNKDIEYRQEQCDLIYEKYFKSKEISVIQNKNKPEQIKNKSYGEDTKICYNRLKAILTASLKKHTMCENPYCVWSSSI